MTAVGLVALMACGGCGGDAAASIDGATEGTLTIAAQNVTGATGKIVLFSVTVRGGGPILGTNCAAVSSDPGSVSAVVGTPAGTNPCSVGPEMLFDNGSYTVNAGIYTPGSQTAERCSAASATVAGDTVVTMPAFGACP